MIKLFRYLGPVMNEFGPILGDVGFVVVFRNFFHDGDDFDPNDAVIPCRTFVYDVTPIRRLGREKTEMHVRIEIARDCVVDHLSDLGNEGRVENAFSVHIGEEAGVMNVAETIVGLESAIG